MTDNSTSRSFATHSSYKDICNSLYNNMKNDDKTSNLIVALLLEFIKIINSKNDNTFDS